MVEVRIDVTIDDEAVKRMVERVKDALEPPALTEEVGAGADEFVKAMREAAPKLTGRLAESIVRTQDGPAAFDIGPDPDIPYAAIQNFGGTIFPVTDPALRFEIGGHVIFAKHVHIPGTHYVDVGFETGLEPAIRAVDDALDQHIKG